MTPLIEDSRPDERHTDLQTLNDSVNEAKKAFIRWVVPLLCTGVCMLIAGFFEQRRMGEKIVELNVQISTMNRRFETLNEKVIVMWSGGGWQQKYNLERHEEQ
jgi:Fe-S oxidoreductase